MHKRLLGGCHEQPRGACIGFGCRQKQDGGFGNITSYFPPRQFQLAFKLLF